MSASIIHSKLKYSNMKKVIHFFIFTFFLLGSNASSEAQIIIGGGGNFCSGTVLATITHYTDECTLYAEGKDQAGGANGNPAATFAWYINNLLIESNPGTNRNFEYTVSSPGDTVDLKLIITVPVLTGTCSDSEIVNNIVLSCPIIIPNCPNGPVNINEVENCIDYQANFHANSLINHIDWYYRICGVNGGNEVFIGTTTGNSSNMHTVPIYLESGHDYDNCILIVNAYLFKDDGTCPKKTGTLTLSCDGNGGNHKISIFPNPTQSSFTVQSNDTLKIVEINVSNFMGTIVESRKTNISGEINLSDEQAGVYFVEVQFIDGTSVVKKLILQK